MNFEYNQKTQFILNKEQIREGYQDILDGRFLKSSGNYKTDLKEFENKENNGW